MERVRDLVAEVEEGLELLVENARFTAAGAAYVDWAEETLGGFRAAV